jgi:hypothetical protein
MAHGVLVPERVATADEAALHAHPKLQPGLNAGMTTGCGHKEETIANYSERWYRIWHVFLAWAATVAGQGTAACFHVVSNKNRNDFDRSIWIGKPSLAERMHLSPGGDAANLERHGRCNAQ